MPLFRKVVGLPYNRNRERKPKCSLLNLKNSWQQWDSLKKKLACWHQFFQSLQSMWSSPRQQRGREAAAGLRRRGAGPRPRGPPPARCSRTSHTGGRDGEDYTEHWVSVTGLTWTRSRSICCNMPRDRALVFSSNRRPIIALKENNHQWPKLQKIAVQNHKINMYVVLYFLNGNSFAFYLKIVEHASWNEVKFSPG